MRVVYTDDALSDLDEILAFIDTNYPIASVSFRQRLAAVTKRIATWPESAEQVAERSGVRVVPLIRYPYRIFYRIEADTVEILHLHHSARREP
jgi:toxin ParE1/3/4